MTELHQLVAQMKTAGGQLRPTRWSHRKSRCMARRKEALTPLLERLRGRSTGTGRSVEDARHSRQSRPRRSQRAGLMETAG